MEESERTAPTAVAIGRLTDGIAHDLNNLLGLLIGRLDLLQLQLGSDGPAMEHLDAALSAALRASDLNRHLLDIARQQALQPVAVQVDEVLSSIRPAMRRILGRRIDISSNLEAGLWPVTVDPRQLEACIFNLCANARDAMRDGGVLTIDLRNVTGAEDFSGVKLASGEHVMIAISDTGGGMSQAVLRRAFEPFYTTKPVGQGSGLGLTMALNFVSRSGGQITLHSEPGAGTSVRLYLPKGDALQPAAIIPTLDQVDLTRA